MAKALNHDHPPMRGWTRPLRVWFRACDDCGKWRITQELHEVYPPLRDNFGWWYACCACVIKDQEDGWVYDNT